MRSEICEEHCEEKNGRMACVQGTKQRVLVVMDSKERYNMEINRKERRKERTKM
jgi:hypothetical protein